MTNTLGRRGIRVNVLSAATANLASACAGFMASVIIARALGPFGKGEYSFILNTLAILLMFAGAGSYTAYAAARHHHGHQPLRLYMGSALVAVGTSIVAGVMLVGLYTFSPGGLFSGVSLAGFAFVLLALFPTILTQYWSGIAAAEDRVVEISIASAAGSLAFLGAVGVLAPLHLLSLATVLPIWLVCSLAPLVAIGPRLRQAPLAGSPRVARDILRLTAIAAVGDLAMFLVLRVDFFIVRALRGFAELGVYSVAVGIAEIILQVGVAVRISLLHQQGAFEQRELLPSQIGQILRVTVALGAVMWVLSIVLGPMLVPLVFGKPFAGASQAIMLLVPGTVAMSIYGPLRDFLVVERRARSATFVAVLALGLNIALNIILLPHHTYLAAAAVSSITYTIGLFGCLVPFVRHTGVKAWRLCTPTRDDCKRAVAGIKLARP